MIQKVKSVLGLGGPRITTCAGAKAKDPDDLVVNLDLLINKLEDYDNFDLWFHELLHLVQNHIQAPCVLDPPRGI